MWLLQDSNGKIIYLKLDKEVSVGRKRCDIILDNDESISRVHAAFIIRPKETVVLDEPISECIIKEKGSKYGTYVINEHGKIKLTTEDYSLKNQDKIKFGLQNHIFTVKYVPMMTVTSALHKDHKQQLSQILDEIDGMVLSQWVDNCTHLTVSEGTLTQKVVLALASVKPIVTLEYWKAVKQAVDNNENLPSVSEFIVQPGELLNRGKVSFVPNEDRKSLFSGKIFIHFAQSQFKDYQKIIKYAGGKPVMYKTSGLPITSLCAKNIIVVQYPISDVTQSTIDVAPEYSDIYKILEEKKFRMIPENEIALAILHISIEKFCNPRFCFSNFMKNSSQTVAKRGSTLVIDTQDLTASQGNTAKHSKRTNSKHYIPETMDEFSQPNSKKTSPEASRNCIVSKKHSIPDSEDFPSQERVSKVHFDASQARSAKQKLSQKTAKIIPETLDFSSQGMIAKVHSNALQATSENQKCGLSQKSVKIIPETLDFSAESSKNVNKKSSSDNPDIVRNIFSQSSISENSSQTRRLLPNPVNALTESRNNHKTKALKATKESQSSKKDSECLVLNNAEESSWKRKHTMHNTYEKVIICDGKRISEKPHEIIPDSQKLKSLVSQLSGENVEKIKHEVSTEIRKKPKVVMISDDDDLMTTTVSQKKLVERFEPIEKRRKKHSDTHEHVGSQEITEVPLRKISVNPCKVFKKTNVNLPRRRIAFRELEIYDATKDMC